MGKRKITAVTQKYPTRRKMREESLTQTIPHLGDILPLVANKLDTREAINSFSVSCKLFYASARKSFCSEIINYISTTLKIDLSFEARTYINNLRYPRHVFILLNKISRLCLHVLNDKLEKDLLFEFNNPLCWALLDDNVIQFKLLAPNTLERLSYLPLALVLARLNLENFLLEEYQTTLTSYKLNILMNFAILSGKMAAVDIICKMAKKRQYNIIYNSFSLRMAYISQSNAMASIIQQRCCKDKWNPATIANLKGYLYLHANLATVLNFKVVEKTTTYPTPDLANKAVFSKDLQKINYVLDTFKKRNVVLGISDKKDLLLAAANTSLNIFLTVENFIGSNQHFRYIDENTLIAAIRYNALDIFYYLMQRPECNEFKVSQTLSLMHDAAILSGSINTLTSVRRYIDENGVKLTPEQKHLNIAAETNTTMYDEILNTSQQDQITLLPNQEIFEKAVRTGSATLVARVLSHAKDCGIELALDEDLLLDVVIKRGHINIFNLLVPMISNEQFKALEYLPRQRFSRLSNPFICDSIDDVLISRHEKESAPALK